MHKVSREDPEPAGPNAGAGPIYFIWDKCDFFFFFYFFLKNPADHADHSLEETADINISESNMKLKLKSKSIIPVSKPHQHTLIHA